MVAAIHGFCLGGGLELALACHYRIAVNDDKTRVGFPEVNLGIFPGFGGTGRSIRQAGPVEAMQAMLTGRMIKASAARRHGAGRQAGAASRHAALGSAQGDAAEAASRRRRRWSKRIMAWGPIRTQIVDRRCAPRRARRRARSTIRRRYALIDLFEKHGDDWRAMIDGEADGFVPLMASDTARNLRRVFFLSESLKKQGVRGGEKPVFARVHVIGAGVMGGDIAAWCALRGHGRDAAGSRHGAHQAGARPGQDAVQEAAQGPRPKSTRRWRGSKPIPPARGLPRADVIIEAVVENLEIKQKIFADAEARAKPDAILATNTSSIELERIAEGLKDPSRLIGLHFFNPVAQLPLVEVIRSGFNVDADVGDGRELCAGDRQDARCW